MEYVYAGRKLAKVEYEGDIDEAQVYYYHHDKNGSPILMTDTDGEEVWKGDYMPFGEDITEQVDWGNAYTFLGNEDDGGLSFFNARYYSPELGRFMSCDPIKLMGSTLSINPYVYSYNNPISYSDASGLIPGQRSSKKGQGSSRNYDKDWVDAMIQVVDSVTILAEEIAETYDETVDVFMPDIPSDNGQGGYGSAFADAKANSNLAEFAGKATNMSDADKKIEDIMEGIIRKKAREDSREETFLDYHNSGVEFGYCSPAILDELVAPSAYIKLVFPEDPDESSYFKAGANKTTPLSYSELKETWRDIYVDCPGVYVKFPYGDTSGDMFGFGLIFVFLEIYNDGYSVGLTTSKSPVFGNLGGLQKLNKSLEKTDYDADRDGIIYPGQ